jgi:hypothetical protein
MMGGALGLAVLASLATSRTDHLRAGGHGQLDALVGGYHLAFAGGALFALAAGVIGVVLLRVPHPGEHGAHAMEPAEATA